MDRRVLPMDPFSWERGWEPGTDAEEIRERVAAVRDHLLSEFFQATTAMVILPGLDDPIRAEGGGRGVRLEFHNHHVLSYSIDRLYVRRTVAEKVYIVIQGLRREIWIYRKWGEKIPAEEYCCLDKRVKAVLHRLKDSLDSLSDGMVHFSEKTLLNGSANIMNGSYPINTPKYWSTTCKNRFYADLGANFHATGNRNLFNLTLVNAGTRVKTADVNSHLMSHGCGYVSSEDFTLPDVHYVPGLGINVVSVSKLAEQDYMLMFVPNVGCSIFDNGTNDQHLLSEFFGMVILPGWDDPQRADAGGVLEEIAATPYHLFPSTPFGLGRAAEEDICFTIKKLRMFLASTDPIDKMERQPWRDCTLMSWATRQILFLACLYSYVMFTLRKWTAGILGDPTVPFKYENQTSFVGSEVRSVSNYSTARPIHTRLIQAPKFRSVHRPLVQMVLVFVQKAIWSSTSSGSLYGGTLACLKSIVPKSIVNLYESGRISEKPKTWSTSTGSACKNADDLTAAEPGNHGAPDSADRRICRIIEAEGKTAATWLIDTGAVHHATGELALISDVTTVNDDDLFITARDGVRMRVCARGSVITGTVVLPDVWYIPGLTKNVVSAAQLNQLGYSIGFTRGTCFIRSATDGTLIGKGHVSEDGLFETDFLKVS